MTSVTRYSKGIYQLNEQVTAVTAIIDLSEREMKIIQMIADGLQNKQLQQMLSLSRTRVQNILQALYDKLGVSGRVGLVRLAIRKGWVKA